MLEVFATKKVLFILDGCDNLIDYNKTKLSEKLEKVISKTSSVKFIIITNTTKTIPGQSTK